jgi:mRNA interferase RelE/StbE
MGFKIDIPHSVIDEISHLSLDTRKHIANAIKTLEEFPFPHGNTVKKVQGTSKPIYRLRVGDYRAIYHLDIAKKQILILTVIHRKDLEKALKTIL